MMMTKTGEGSSATMDDLFSLDDGSDDVLIDLDCFWNIMEEPSDIEEGGLEAFPPSNDALQGSQNSNDALSLRSGFPEVGVQSPSYNSEASDYRMGCSDDISEPAGNPVVLNSEKLEQSPQLSSAENICSTSINNCKPVQGNGLSHAYSDGGSLNASSFCKVDSKKAPFEIPSHRGTFGFHSANHITNKGESSDFCQPNHEEDLFRHSGVGVHSEILYHNKLMKESNLGTSVRQMEDFSIIDRDRSSYASHTDSSSCEITGADIPDILSEDGDMYFLSPGHPSYSASPKEDFPYSSGFKSLANDDGGMVHVVDEGQNPTEDFTSLIPSLDHAGIEFRRHSADCGSGSSVSFNRGIQLTNFNEMDVMESELAWHSPNTLSNVQRKVLDHNMFEKDNGSVTSIEIVSRASEVIRDIFTEKCYGGRDELSATEGIEWISSNSLPSISHTNYVSHAKDEQEDILLESKRTLLTLGSVGETPVKNSAAVAHDWHRVLQVLEQPGILPSPSVKAEFNCLKLENNVPTFSGSYLSNTTYQRVQNSSFEQSIVDDDPDLCILEDMSAPARQIPTSMDGKVVVASQFSTSRGPHNQTATGQLRLKSNNERVIFRVVLQDLSQPKSEATLPDGVLAVPLLKHQRIALSWMVNKETKSACCSGGILADDQGLGKTISTIALILKERSSSSKAPKANKEQSEAETLNLDDDDDDVLSEEGAESPLVNGCPINGGKTHPQGKGRPAAGTLIVCPTSVLRQWSDELHNKVTSEADLSVLVYHGSNRTKDPFELAKYDVVITTYAIVSMEVPKQPVVNENDDLNGTPFTGFSSSKKRKLLETMPDKKPSRSKKSKKGIDNELFETISGPLAKVGWFRIVLDEAQSIKNHRTQVARACWGLRAKRRWCLSGTPIQNAIDDLYSYFRFLRHEPYAVFRTFCEQLKAPIHKNPKDGYKKLQAVLRTIMLRRTKGTFIDGEPIINLPPKTIEMKKVDFSKEERDFYCRLEAESRAQFAEYAAAGTVKQNYVNILLMLLRLRQACDHPLLVKGSCSNSKMTSSIEMAKKLSQEKQIFLLNCLEASLAICGICSDPPEDAVVTICGHVYCNQCICQHVIGDDTQCPTKNCKTHLSSSCVFSITTLRSSLSDQLSVENTHNCSDSVLAEINEPCSLSRPQDSSKIKAALELLLSLSKPHCSALSMSSSESLEGGYGTRKLHVCDSEEENGTSDMHRNSINSVTVVGEKAIVFSQWTRMLDLLEACLKNSSIQYRRLDGTMPVVARDRAVKDFNTLPQVSVMIMSLKAASLGLNMVAACHVLLLDLWWNPTTEDQAIDRAHRIGQTRPVSVFRLTVKDTVEDRILALQDVLVLSLLTVSMEPLAEARYWLWSNKKNSNLGAVEDLVTSLPGQPSVNFEHYAGYVTVNETNRRALFYWFYEAATLAREKPLVLWLNGANDAYAFLHKWLHKFPSYRTRTFYIAGESYAGKYVPELAELIHDKNKDPSLFIDLKGILLGNPETFDAEDWKGMVDYAWSHAVVSDETHQTIVKSCDFYSDSTWSNSDCSSAVEELLNQYKEIDIYSLYTSVCIVNSSRSEDKSTLVTSSSSLKMMPRVMGGYDPCLDDYTKSYYNRPDVQKALHVADGTNLKNWSICNMTVFDGWSDSKGSVLPIYKKLIAAGFRIWIYSGDTDGRVPVLSTRYSLSSLGLSIKRVWRPWYHQKQVGGWIQEYHGLTFATFRGAGHAVPIFKPSESLAFFSSFLSGETLPSQR